jgi:hypothetical protein
MTYPISTPERDALEAEVVDIARQLSPDELRVVRFIASRMIRIGHGKYGPLDLSGDRRSWRRERSEETSDRVFYDSCVELAEESRRLERIACFRHDEAFNRVDEAMKPLVEEVQPGVFVMKADNHQVAEILRRGGK